MNSLIIIIIIGMGILTTATLGVGATLATPLEFNLIGASDNVPVPSARANVTSIDFIVEVGSAGVIQTNGTIFTVGNEDTINAHIFEVCLTMEGPIGVFSPASGSAPACKTTASIPANGKLVGQTIYISPQINVTSLLNISVSIEELT